MKTILFLIVLAIACGGAYLTRPAEAAMKSHVDDLLSGKLTDDLKKGDIGDVLKGGVAAVARTNAFNDYYVVTRYTATSNDKPLASCWGVYSQILCTGPSVKADAK
jgi:hypothetical protein